MQAGKLFIISGPSGVGKKTIQDELFKNPDLNLARSISMTTRQPRNGEQNGKDYYFVSQTEFEQKIEQNHFLEYAIYNKNYYGTPKSFVKEKLNKGINVLLEIETEGVKKLLACDLEPIKIFIAPPSFASLKQRLLTRNTETQDIINQRLEKAKKELQLTYLYDYVVVNDDLQKAIQEITNIIQEELENQ